MISRIQGRFSRGTRLYAQFVFTKAEEVNQIETALSSRVGRTFHSSLERVQPVKNELKVTAPADWLHNASAVEFAKNVRRDILPLPFVLLGFILVSLLSQ